MIPPESGAPPRPLVPDELLAACVHCGLCLEACPTFVETGREEESPRGRLHLMRALADGTFGSSPEVLAPLAHCLGCRSCETACPSGVQYGAALEWTRESASAAGPNSVLERLLVRRILWRGGLLEKWVRLYRWFRIGTWMPKLALWRWLPRKWRRLAALAPQLEGTPRDRIVPVSLLPGAPVARLLRGCVARAAFGETEAAMVRLLAAAGYRVERRDDPPCCGALARHAGEADLARRFARGIFQNDEGTEGTWVPTAAGCGAHLKDLAGIFPPGEGQDRGRELAPRVRDLSEALLEGPRPLPLRPRPRRILFQDPCHLRHGQGISDGPRRLLRETGAELVEPLEADLCCGSAGTYNLFQADLAFRLGRRKADVLLATGVTCVVTANPGCHLQLEAHVRGSGVEVVSLARFLAAHLPPLPEEGGQVII